MYVIGGYSHRNSSSLFLSDNYGKTLEKKVSFLSNLKREHIPLPAFPPGGSEVGKAPSYGRGQGHNWPVIFSLTPRVRRGIHLTQTWRMVWTLEGTGRWAYFLATIIIGTMDRSAHGLTGGCLRKT